MNLKSDVKEQREISSLDAFLHNIIKKAENEIRNKIKKSPFNTQWTYEYKDNSKTDNEMRCNFEKISYILKDTTEVNVVFVERILLEGINKSINPSIKFTYFYVE